MRWQGEALLAALALGAVTGWHRRGVPYAWDMKQRTVYCANQDGPAAGLKRDRETDVQRRGRVANKTWSEAYMSPGVLPRPSLTTSTRRIQEKMVHEMRCHLGRFRDIGTPCLHTVGIRVTASKKRALSGAFPHQHATTARRLSSGNHGKRRQSGPTHERQDT